MHAEMVISLDNRDCNSFLIQAKKLLVKGGTVVNEDRKFLSDVYCEDGIIKWARAELFGVLHTLCL